MAVYIDKILDSKLDLLRFYQFQPEFYPVLLESVSHHSDLARFDILFIDPLDTLVLNANNQLKYQDINQVSFEHLFESNHFLNAFDKLFSQFQTEQKLESNYPFNGGWFTFLSYEIAHQIEPVIGVVQSESSLPYAYAIRFQSALIYDHVKNELVLISESQTKFKQLKSKIYEDIQHLPTFEKLDLKVKLLEDESIIFTDAVNKIKEYIIQGDVFQVNLSRKWQADLGIKDLYKSAAHIYRALRIANPAPFSCLANIENNVIISSSPERLVKVHDVENKKHILSRPIAGTRPRGQNLENDLDLKNQLHDHPKERAEHVMLIDLIRNDLGRVCKPGSIHVDEFMVNESYETVHHIVSNVTGLLRQNISPGKIIQAMFPGGTITGCPKVRCMEIIAELEQCQREAYTGSLGYINHDGTLDLNILIRTIQLKQEANKHLKLSFRAGAGIVNDSIASNELKETRAKALGMINAINLVDNL
ncbi:MAG: aminodeoxychorismate synthase component I [Gammaproteobacteria bacterium]|nr:aminodeoxychorismate synthase component I [Gammaproteobacteria bacterium]